MSGTLYEGYKDALRRGHLAALRGRLETAVAAYREASRMAPDRALPYVGLGEVLARLGRPDEALAAYAAALGRAPGDEAALRGRADVQAETGHRAEAAATLDRLAAVLEGQGRLADACDVARSRPGAGRIARPAQGVHGPRGTSATGLRRSSRGRGPGARVERPGGRPGVRPRTLRSLGRRRRGQPPGGGPGAGGAATAVDPGALTLAVEAAIDAGNLDETRRTAVLAVRGHRSLGQLHAAIDACYEALAIAPADPEIHLALAELYLDQGWRTLSADKLVLLGRLAELTGDSAARARLCALVAARFTDEPRLVAICA